KFLPFDQMEINEKLEWQNLVSFLLHRTNFLKPVSNNSSKKGGIMYADGWRKYSQKEIFGRYINSSGLSRFMKEKGFDVNQEETQYKKIGSLLASNFRNIARGAFDINHNQMVEEKLPSFTSLNYCPEKGYQHEDFSTAITFTFDGFFNTSHCDRDGSEWTLIGFIPILAESGFLAGEEFDVEGGQFILRDHRIAVDFSKISGITLLVLDTAQIKHQTVESVSLSGKYTRFAFSCQVSKSLKDTLFKY
ncbi:hypothetical protein BY996DRAFT_4569577, partial [Phakopsora pachyrhizi]